MILWSSAMRTGQMELHLAFLRPCAADRAKQNFFCPGGHDNPLKRLISDKEIQGKQSIFLGNIWLKLGLAWPGFDKFGVGLGEAQL
jgi:hypothetical protein